MRIYTRTGDTGETGLIGGQRVPKDDPRVEAYGSVDELNAALGVARCYLSDLPDLDALLERFQNELFDIGAELASPPERAAQFQSIEEQHITAIEEAIDRLETELEPLRQFILPGGSPASAYLHLARTVCRRAERQVVRLSHSSTVNAAIIKYLNRLSDLLFVMARVANRRVGVDDVKWGEPGWRRKRAQASEGETR
ncbi:MAG: cob(I)yrinic acid a,c-diamide adenosyltransferase [Fimbriimonadales bacterium]|nr:cob(I)yrinic acid a,c-diamide adenosyltransferase [Fimbriimonadales bacterium]